MISNSRGTLNMPNRLETPNGTEFNVQYFRNEIHIRHPATPSQEPIKQTIQIPNTYETPNPQEP